MTTRKNQIIKQSRSPKTNDKPESRHKRKRSMTGEIALSLLSKMLIAAALISAPILIANLVTGVIISIIQVVTQIQESTLTFVPKLGISIVIILMFGPWMMGAMQDFTVELFSYAARIK